MQLSSDKIPNKMLTGPELLEIAVQEFRSMLSKDFAFQGSIAYRRAAFTLSGTFHLGVPFPADHIARSRVKPEGAIEGEVPLVEVPGEETHLVSLERDISLDNPNLARVQHDMPIVVQEKKPPKSRDINTPLLPGEIPQDIANPFPEIETHNLRYDKAGYPPADPPVDRDVSDKKAKELGVKGRNKG